MLLHIPHSSTNLHGITFDHDIAHEIGIMTDWFTDEIFEHTYSERVVFGVSRLVCDVERFTDASREVMEKHGMGVCYTKTSNGGTLRAVDREERERIIETYYKPHHRRVENVINAQLNRVNTVFLVDCHSFSNTVLAHEEDSNRPDFCIGTDEEHTPVELVRKLEEYFSSKGYTIAINSPFAGTLVPTIFRDNEYVKSIMIEVNRNLYLDDHFNKSENFCRVKDLVTEALNIISKVENTYYLESFVAEILNLEYRIEHLEEQSWYFKSALKSQQERVYELTKCFESLRNKINNCSKEKLITSLHQKERELANAENCDGGGSRWIRSILLGNIRGNIKTLKLHLNIKDMIGVSAAPNPQLFAAE